MATLLRGAALLRPERDYTCPNCTVRARSRELRPHTPFHICRGLRGLTAPLVPAGIRCEVVAVEREDYVGRELVQRDADGRPKMAVVTTRDDGTDCAVLAPCARLTTEDREALRDGAN